MIGGSFQAGCTKWLTASRSDPANAVRRRDQEGQGAAMSAEATTPEHEKTVTLDELRPVLMMRSIAFVRRQ